MYRANSGLPMDYPSKRPHQVLGLEINEYAQQLAQIATWSNHRFSRYAPDGVSLHGADSERSHAPARSHPFTDRYFHALSAF